MATNVVAPASDEARVEAVARHCYKVMERRIVPLPPFEKLDHFLREWWLKCARAAIAATKDEI
jgi:hypothetical protein